MDFQDFLQSGFSFKNNEKEIKAKYILLNSIMVIGMSLGVAMIIVHAWNLLSFSHPQQALHLAIYNALSFLTMLYLRRSRKNFVVARNVFYGLSLAIISSDVILLDGEQARLAWYTVIIIPAFFLGGQRFGLIVLGWSIALMLSIYFIFEISYDGGEVMYGVFLYVTVAILTSFYEKNREDVYKELVELNANLEGRVDLLMEEEKAKNALLLKQSRQAQMGEMIGVIAHQWKQPLGAIAAASSSVSVQLSFMDEEDGASITESEAFISERMDAIMTYVHNLTDTMDDFRTFFSPNKVKDKACSCVAVEKALGILNNTLQKAHIEVTLHCNTQTQIDLFLNEMCQVIINIVKNAHDNFVEKECDNRTITIQVYDGPKHQKITIEDNGGGIPEEHLGSIFNSYFTTKSEDDGTGIGLYMSTMIVQDHHHGELSVYNTGEGACFVIELPLSSAT